MTASTRIRLAVAATLLFAIPEGQSQQSRIVGGDDAPPGAYPWMAALVVKGAPSVFSGQMCGGSLIHPHWVVTAAHCVEGRSPGSLEIWAGIDDLDNTGGAERRDVRAIYIHPGYGTARDGTLVGDIALILLDAPINNIQPVAYAPNNGLAPTGLEVRVLGWGDTQDDPRFPTALQQADLNLVSITQARNAYRTSSLDSRHLAAGASDRDTCNGDSGGPLFDLDGDGGDPLLLGITSFGLGCDSSTIPGIYANVGTYESWLDLFLAQPTTNDPNLTVVGRGRAIANGTRSVAKLKGTHFGRRIKGGRKRTKRFVLANAGGSIPLSVTNARATNRFFSIRRSPNYVFGGSHDVLAIRFRAPRSRKNRRVRSSVLVWTNDSTDLVYSFRIMAQTKKVKPRRQNFRRFGF